MSPGNLTIVHLRWLAVVIPMLILPAHLSAQAPSAAGTYAVWFCATTCEAADTAAAPVKGYLALFEDTLLASVLPEAARSELANRSRRLLFITPAIGSVSPNACFAVEGTDSSFWFLQSSAPGALTVWGRPDDSIEVRLSASPDALHTLTATVEGERLQGVVRFHGIIGQSFDHEVASVHGFRVGPPDVNRCVN